MFRCVYPNCSYRTNSSTEIGYHVSRSHFGVTSKPIDCPKCKMAFQTFRSFVVHSHLEHKEIPPNIEEYDHFLTKHLNYLQFKCVQCGNQFTTATNARLHIQQ